MSDTTSDGSGWTVETLRIYLDARISHLEVMLRAAGELSAQRFENQNTAVQAALVAQEKAIAAALAAAERAVGKSEIASEKRFDAVNEFRAQLADQTATFIPRTETEQRIAVNAEKIDALATRIDKSEGHSGGLNAGWVILATAIGVLGTVVALYFAVRQGQ